MWRIDDDDPSRGLAGDGRALSYNEAGRWLDAQERVDNVPLPADVVDWLQAYTDEHYRPEPKKRKRRPQSFVAAVGSALKRDVAEDDGFLVALVAAQGAGAGEARGSRRRRRPRRPSPAAAGGRAEHRPTAPAAVAPLAPPRPRPRRRRRRGERRRRCPRSPTSPR